MSNETLSLEGLIFTTLELEEKDHIFTITFNRPARKNAMSDTMVTELNYALDYAKQQRSIRVVVIAANGDVFCAGGDLKGMSGKAADGPVSNVPKRGEIDDYTLKLYNINKPTIAKIQGPVLAGALLTVCNVTHAIAADHAFFSAPEILRGLWPFQVMAGLFRLVPARVGLDWIMRGYRIDAKKAEQWGLINESVPADELDAKVAELAAELANLAPSTMQQGLAGYRAQDMMSFDDALPFLRGEIDKCVASADAQEGIAAFFEKRKPNWK